MVYLILAVNLAVLGLIAAFVTRLVRASKVERGEMLGFQKYKRAIILLSSVFVAAVLVVGCVFFFLVGTTGIRAGSAAKDFLREKYGQSETWELSLGKHIERSKKPEAGSYEVDYQYAGKRGVLLVEYAESDGRLAFKVSPKENENRRVNQRPEANGG